MVILAKISEKYYIVLFERAIMLIPNNFFFSMIIQKEIMANLINKKEWVKYRCECRKPKRNVKQCFYTSYS